MRIKYRHQNDGKDKELSEAAAWINSDPSLTVQSQAQEADINWIIKTYGGTGQLPNTIAIPQYGDYTEIGDYRSALDAVRRAQEDFMKLDAKTRAHFENDPQRFLEACTTPGNEDELRSLGLTVPQAAAAPASQAVEPEKPKPGTT